MRVAERVRGLYLGSLLQDESAYPPIVAARERVRAKVLRISGRLARFWRTVDAADAAADWLEAVIEADPLSEGLYRHLMQSYESMKQTGDAIDAFERCRAILEADAGRKPSRETVALYERITGL